MKKRITCFIILVALLLQGIVYAKELKEITAYIVNHKLNFNAFVQNKDLEYPLLSYDNHTYISLRDMSKMLSRNIEWNNEREEIYITKSTPEENLIQSKETALSIGKALAEELYSEKLTENTRYAVSYTVVTSTTYENFYDVGILFNPAKEKFEDSSKELLYILNEGDVRIEISPIDGSVKILEKVEDGDWVYVRQ